MTNIRIGRRAALAAGVAAVGEPPPCARAGRSHQARDSDAAHWRRRPLRAGDGQGRGRRWSRRSTRQAAFSAGASCW